MKVDIFNTNKKYDIIYTDPPWEQGKGGKKKARPNSSGGKLDYLTMNLQEIEELHKTILSRNTNVKHNVFMWTINKYLVETQKFMEGLGYTLHARIIWNKTTGMSPAFTVRFQTEYLLWFYKKKNILMPRKETRGKYADIMTESVKKHSQKPICAYEMLEDMFPDSEKLEMFAREHRENWECWGNEIT